MRDVFLNSIINFTYKDKQLSVNCRDILKGPRTVAFNVISEILSLDFNERDKFQTALKLFNESMYIELKVKGYSGKRLRSEALISYHSYFSFLLTILIV